MSMWIRYLCYKTLQKDATDSTDFTDLNSVKSVESVAFFDRL